MEIWYSPSGIAIHSIESVSTVLIMTIVSISEPVGIETIRGVGCYFQPYMEWIETSFRIVWYFIQTMDSDGEIYHCFIKYYI